MGYQPPDLDAAASADSIRHLSDKGGIMRVIRAIGDGVYGYIGDRMYYIDARRSWRVYG